MCETGSMKSVIVAIWGLLFFFSNLVPICCACTWDHSEQYTSGYYYKAWLQNVGLHGKNNVYCAKVEIVAIGDIHKSSVDQLLGL
jgi:hypothetical protein